MQRLFIILFFLLFFLHSKAQGDSLFIPERIIAGKIADFAVDNLGNTYILYDNGQLRKLDAGGDSVAVFNDIRRYGKLHSVDVSNPLKVLLYFRDFGTIVILDRFLNPRAVVDLRRQGLFQVKAIAQSYDNNIWVFDELESKLKRIRDDGTLIDQFTDFRMIFDSMPSPEIILDQHKQVYLYDPEMGIYVFDYYGTFRTRLPFLHWQDVAVSGNAVFGRSGNIIYRYEPGSLVLKQYHLPESYAQARKVVITPKAVYRLDDGAIHVFSYPE